MKHATLIDATDLDARADYLEGRVELPALLRRLIVTTTPSLKAVQNDNVAPRTVLTPVKSGARLTPGPGGTGLSG